MQTKIPTTTSEPPKRWWQRPTKFSPWCCYQGSGLEYKLSFCGSWKTKRVAALALNEAPHDDMCFECARRAQVKYVPARPKLVLFEHFPREILVGEPEVNEPLAIQPEVDYTELGVE